MDFPEFKMDFPEIQDGKVKMERSRWKGQDGKVKMESLVAASLGVRPGAASLASA